MSEGEGRFKDPSETEILLPYLLDGVKVKQNFSPGPSRVVARLELLSAY